MGFQAQTRCKKVLACKHICLPVLGEESHAEVGEVCTMEHKWCGVVNL